MKKNKGDFRPRANLVNSGLNQNRRDSREQGIQREQETNRDKDQNSLKRDNEKLQEAAERLGQRARRASLINGANSGLIIRPASANKIEPVLPATKSQSVARTGLTFSRFLGLNRLTNWYYSSKESELISLQKSIKDSLNDFDDLYKNHPEYYGAVKTPELISITAEMQQISNTNITNIVNTDVGLAALKYRLDRESIKQATLLGLDRYFSQGSPKTVPDKQAIINTVMQSAHNPSIREAGELRYLLDAVSQWTSDALLRIPAEASLEPLLSYKQTIAESAALVNESFFTAMVKRDYDSALRIYEKACLLIQSVNFAVIAGPEGVKPKAREDFNTPFDPGCGIE
jgi:hypothetical protein